MRHGHHCRSGRGPSSFRMQSPELLFKELALEEGETLLDLGCSVGDYSIEALNHIGEKGFIHAIDINPDSISALNETIVAENITNIRTIVSDILKPLSLPDKSIDRCLIATVLHTVDLSEMGIQLFTEIDRVMKYGSRISVLECNPIRDGFGPPEKYRVSSEYLEELIIPFGYEKISCFDFGHNYLIQFRKRGGEYEKKQ